MSKRSFENEESQENIKKNNKIEILDLLDNKIEMFKFIKESLTIKSIEKKQNGEVFTPMEFIEQMLNSLETYYGGKHIWECPNRTFFDPAAGIGNFFVAIYYKLMDGLTTIIPNNNSRKQHIIEKMLYMSEFNNNNCNIIRKIFNPNNHYQLNLHEGDSLLLDISKIFKCNSFDIIIGNPPYNEPLKSTGANALYHQFIESFITKCRMMTYVIPSRWFSGGKGVDKFRQHMLTRKDIVYINHFNNASKIFGNNVEIKGGVNFFLIDHHYNGLCLFNNISIQLNRYDVLIDNPEYYSIIDKIIQFNKKITSIYQGRCFGIETNDKRLEQLIINSDQNNYIKCHVSQIKLRELKSLKHDFYFFKDYLKDKEFNYWKVITAEAAHKHRSGFGNIFKGKPNEVHSGSFISFKVNTEDEANSLISFLKCKLPNFLLSIRKNSQHINEDVCKWIPLPPLNQIWNDENIYKFFDISKNNIQLIELVPLK